MTEWVGFFVMTCFVFLFDSRPIPAARRAESVGRRPQRPASETLSRRPPKRWESVLPHVLSHFALQQLRVKQFFSRAGTSPIPSTISCDRPENVAHSIIRTSEFRIFWYKFIVNRSIITFKIRDHYYFSSSEILEHISHQPMFANMSRPLDNCSLAV